jgi:hypothetical protein
MFPFRRRRLDIPIYILKDNQRFNATRNLLIKHIYFADPCHARPTSIGPGLTWHGGSASSEEFDPTDRACK